MLTTEKLYEFIQLLGTASDNMLDKHLSVWCRDCPPPPKEDPLRLLRDVVDMAVFCAGAPRDLLIIMEDLAHMEDEPETEKVARRETLEARCVAKQYGI
jgi:hypothetical protein